MSIRGNAAVAAVVCAAVAAGVVILWPASSSAPAPTSEQVKASAQARLDASLKAGRTAREGIRAVGKTPDDEQCQTAWDNLLDSEQHGLWYSMWTHGCADAPQ